MVPTEEEVLSKFNISDVQNQIKSTELERRTESLSIALGFIPHL